MSIARAIPLLLALALPFTARAEDATFDISIRGLTAARLTMTGQADARSYSAAGVLQSAGLLSLVRAIRYDASVTGTVAQGRPVPARYTEKADTGKRKSDAVMDYRAGVPQVKSYSPPRPPRVEEIDPATQGGTVDPLTALFFVVRAVPEAKACNLKLTLFDGRRRSQVTLAAPERDPSGALTCAGEYRRLKGFTPDDMAEKSRFAFRVTYGPAGPGMLHVTDIAMDTIYGQGRMIRR